MISDSTSLEFHLFFRLNLLSEKYPQGCNSSTLHDTFLTPPNIVNQLNKCYVDELQT